MDFSFPQDVNRDLERFKDFLSQHLVPHLSTWYHEGAVPREFFRELGRDEWLAAARRLA